MNSVIIYDVASPNEAIIRERMRAKGYFSTWAESTTVSNVINLPHNALWKPNTESQQALNDLNQVIFELNLTRLPPQQIILLRCVVLNSTPWKAIYGNPL